MAEYNSGDYSLLHCSDCADIDEEHSEALLYIFTAFVTSLLISRLAHCDMVVTEGLSQSLLGAVMPCDYNFSSVRSTISKA